MKTGRNSHTHGEVSVVIYYQYLLDYKAELTLIVECNLYNDSQRLCKVQPKGLIDSMHAIHSNMALHFVCIRR